MRTEKKHQLKQLRKWRIRNKLTGTKDRPRMSVCFTNENIHVQFIDDKAGVTLAATSTTGKTVPERDKLAANVAGARIIGKLAALSSELAQRQGRHTGVDARKIGGPGQGGARSRLEILNQRRPKNCGGNHQNQTRRSSAARRARASQQTSR
jgi:large subunit ribosomal protein L18